MQLDCPDCGQAMVLRVTHALVFADRSPRKFWGCSAFPECRAIHGAHPDGRPLGVPADRETKRQRQRAHREFDRLWNGGLMTRTEAYAVLADLMGLDSDAAHIAKFTADQCVELVRRLRNLCWDTTETTSG